MKENRGRQGKVKNVSQVAAHKNGSARRKGVAKRNGIARRNCIAWKETRQ